jgi:serine/threonine protein kinase/tetratricopeptide (TPR) repeat protein
MESGGLALQTTRASWSTIRGLYDRASALSPDQWDSFLDENAPDREVRNQVRRLLAASASAVKFFTNLGREIQNIEGVPSRFNSGYILNERFRVVGFIAAGGMGEVYEAEDLELGGQVAIKLMRPYLTLQENNLQRFRDEIRLARTINNLHVCRVYDVAKHTDELGRDLLFFSMELLEGETVSQRLARNGPFEIKEVSELLRQMVDGLDAAHRAGVLHRDFKSSNLILSSMRGELRLVITDFGLSRVAEQQSREDLGLADGITPAYVAPEQLLHEQETPATDVYSLGVVLFEMLTGTWPYEGDSVWEIANKRLTEPPRSLRKLRQDLPVSWVRVVERCLEREPSRRFARAGDIARELKLVDVGSLPTRRLALLGISAGLVVPLLALWKWNRLLTDSQPVAVLAIMEPNSAEDMRYIANGLADRISDEATRLPGIRIIGSQATKRLEGQKMDATALKKQFRATHFVSGSVEGRGQDIRISIALEATETSARVWSATFESTQSELEGITRKIVDGLVRAIYPGIKPAEASALLTAWTKDPEAYRNFLLGRYYSARRDTDSLKASISYLKESVRLDGGFAEAWSALALVLHMISPKDGVDRNTVVYQSDDCARRALALDSTLGEPYVVLGANDWLWRWNWISAENQLRHAIELNPNSPTAHHWYARVLYPQRRFREALAEINSAAELDPLDRSLGIARGSILLYSGNVDDAILQYRLVQSYDPAHSNVYVPLSVAYVAKGLFPDARDAAVRAVALTGGASFALSQLGHVEAASGHYNEAMQILDQLKGRYDAGLAAAAEVAGVYEGWRDVANTLDWLERGAQTHDTSLIILNVSPEFTFLQKERRFQELVRKLNLPN